MRILYLMHVDWHWIKQRPHYLAECLAVNHEVQVVYRMNPSRRQLCKNESRVHRLPLLPVPRRWGVLWERLDGFLQRLWLQVIALRFRPDAVWVTFPSLYAYLPKSLLRLPIVYDCMDDAIGFYRDEAIRERTASLEGKLVDRAELALFSSQTLYHRIRERYGTDRHFHLVRNGLSDELLQLAVTRREAQAPDTETPQQDKQFLDLAYTGTISSWFDFPSVLHVLDNLPSVRMHLVGPLELTIPKHERLIYHGVVDRTELPEYADQFDAFLMPFITNSLIQAVEPVKLYEYLACGKESIAVYYDEIERFTPYLHFYRSADELSRLVERLQTGVLERKAAPESVLAFLANNVWEERVRQVEFLLKELYHDR